jgi:hypothetical protein
MSTYFTHYERQLIKASRALNQTVGGRARRKGWLRRSVLVPVVAVAVAAPAIAATQPWKPLLGDTSLGPPATSASDAPPAAELSAMAVLRRAQTDQDRGPQTEAALRYFGHSAQGVHVDHIRLLEDRGGGAVILVPVQSYTPLDNSYSQALRERFNVHDGLCVFYPSSTGDGGAKGCYSLSQLQAGEATGQLGTHHYGLVPDGVTSVRVGYSDGQVATASVSNNFYDIVSPVDPNADDPAPPRPEVITWLDADGHPIKEIQSSR